MGGRYMIFPNSIHHVPVQIILMLKTVNSLSSASSYLVTLTRYTAHIFYDKLYVLLHLNNMLLADHSAKNVKYFYIIGIGWSFAFHKNK